MSQSLTKSENWKLLIGLLKRITFSQSCKLPRRLKTILTVIWGIKKVMKNYAI